MVLPRGVLLAALLALRLPAAAGVHQAPAAQVRPAQLAARATPEWFGALAPRLQSFGRQGLIVDLPSYRGDPGTLLGAPGALGPLVAELEKRGYTPASVGRDERGVIDALEPAAWAVQEMAEGLAAQALSEAPARPAAELARDLDDTLRAFSPYLSQDRLAQLRLAAAAARVRSSGRLSSSPAYLEAEGWRKPRREPDPLVFAAASFAQGLSAASDELALARKRGLAPSEPAARVARAVLERREMLLSAKSADAETVDWLAAELLRVLGRWTGAHGAAVLPWAVDEAVGRLTRMTHKRWFVVKPFNDAARFREKVAASFDAMVLRGQTAASTFVALGQLAAIGVGFAVALAQAAFPPLPASLDWGRLFSLDLLAGPIAAWTFLSLGFMYLSALAGEAYDKRFQPLEYMGRAKLMGQLPFLMVLEEGIFRLGLLILPAWGLTLLGLPLLPAILAAAVAGAALFARVHTYGPKLPRFVAGLTFGYVALVYGLPSAVLVHLLLDLILFAGWFFSQSLSTKTAAPPRD